MLVGPLCLLSHRASGLVVNTIITEEKKEMFYLTTHSTHCYLWLYGVRHMVKDHSDSERKSTAASTWATLIHWQQGFFYMHHPTDRIAYDYVTILQKL